MAAFGEISCAEDEYLDLGQQSKSAFVTSASNMMHVKLLIRLPNTQRINEYAKPWPVKNYPAPTHSGMIPKDMYAIYHRYQQLYTPDV